MITPTSKQSSYTFDGREYVLHTIALASSDQSEDAIISCVLDPTLVPLLPDPLPSAQKPINNPSFCVLRTPHKGAGLFAVRDIPAGELIVTEHPALILPPRKFPAEIYGQLGLQLPEKRRGELFAMANARSKEECETHVEGIVRTNALMLELDPKGKIPEDAREIYGGVYPLINRANHSCGPNATVKWDLASLTLSLYALRPIAAGEEISKTYVNPILSREKRMTILQQNYRFRCDCPWCNIRFDMAQSQRDDEVPFTVDEIARIAASDENRERLGSWIFTHLGYKKWYADFGRKDDVVIGSHLEALSLIEKEGMQGMQNLFMEEIAMCYAMLGDLDHFKKWGQRVVQLSQFEDPALSRRFEDWLIDPEKRMKKWAWRKHQRKQTSGKRAGHSQELETIDTVGAFDLLYR